MSPGQGNDSGAAETSGANKPLQFIALGDSLTKGYYDQGRAYAPYTDVLKDNFGSAIEVVNLGVDGETSEQICERMINLPRLGPKAVVAILAGTNDIGRGVHSDQISETLYKMYNLALDQKAFVVGMTVPQSVISEGEHFEEKQRLNDWIRWYFGKLDSSFGTLIDLYNAIPYEYGGKVWSDYLHFSPAGYQRVGQLIGSALQDIIDQALSDSESRSCMAKLTACFCGTK